MASSDAILFGRIQPAGIRKILQSTSGSHKDVFLQYYDELTFLQTILPLQISYLAHTFQEIHFVVSKHTRVLQRRDAEENGTFLGRITIQALSGRLQQGNEVALPTTQCSVEVEAENKRTAPQAQTLNPVWNQSFTFAVTKPCKTALVTVQSTVNPMYRGSVHLPLKNFEHQEPVEGWYTLLKDNRTAFGEVSLAVQYSFPPTSLARDDGQVQKSFIIGILGCGQIGRAILDSLLRCGSFKASQIMISTRRPHLLSAFTTRGVEVMFDNKKLAQSADILILACQPMQLNTAASSIRPFLQPTCPVVSIVSGVTHHKLVQLLGERPIIRVSMDTSKVDHNSGVQIAELLGTHEKAVVNPLVDSAISSQAVDIGISTSAACQKQLSNLAFDSWVTGSADVFVLFEQFGIACAARKISLVDAQKMCFETVFGTCVSPFDHHQSYDNLSEFFSHMYGAQSTEATVMNALKANFLNFCERALANIQRSLVTELPVTNVPQI